MVCISRRSYIAHITTPVPGKYWYSLLWNYRQVHYSVRTTAVVCPDQVWIPYVVCRLKSPTKLASRTYHGQKATNKCVARPSYNVDKIRTNVIHIDRLCVPYFSFRCTSDTWHITHHTWWSLRLADGLIVTWSTHFAPLIPRKGLKDFPLFCPFFQEKQKIRG